MKKNKIMLALASIGLIILSGCKSKDKISENEKLFNEAIDAYLSFEENQLSSGYEIKFNQAYSLSYGENEDLYSLSYESSGNYIELYEKSDGVESTKLYNDGKSHFSGKQSEKVNLNQNFIDAEGQTKNRKANYEFDHTFSIRYDDTELKCEGKSVLKNNLLTSNPKVSSFIGKIDKELIGGEEGFTDEYLESLKGEILSIHAWKHVNEFIFNFNTYFDLLKLDNKANASKFIKDNNVKASLDSNDNNIIKVEFNLDSEDMINIINAEDSIIDGIIPSTILVNKDEKSIISYEFDLKNAYNNLLDKSKGTKANYQASINEFIIQCNNLNTSFEKLEVKDKFMKYDSSTISDFKALFELNVIPSIDYNFEIIE